MITITPADNGRKLELMSHMIKKRMRELDLLKENPASREELTPQIIRLGTLY